MASANPYLHQRRQEGLRNFRLSTTILFSVIVPCVAKTDEGSSIRMDADVTGGLFLEDAVKPATTPAPASAASAREAPRVPEYALGIASGALLQVGLQEVIRRKLPAKAGAWATSQVARLTRLRSRAHQRHGHLSNEPGSNSTLTISRAVANIWAGSLALGSLLLVVRRLQRQRVAGSTGVAKPATPRLVQESEKPATPSKRPKSKAAPPPPPPRLQGKRPAGLNAKAAPLTKPTGLDQSDGQLSPRSLDNTPFGKKIHWVKPSCQEPEENTIFGELNSPRSKLQFDKHLLEAMFTPRGNPGSGMGSSRSSLAMSPRKSWPGPKPQGLALLDNGRAQNIAIMLSKLNMNTEELCKCVLLFDTGHLRLRADNIEMLALAMPTTTEAEKLLAHKDKEKELRDVEKRMLPLCSLSPARMKIMKFAISHQHTRQTLLDRCKAIQYAAEESRNSMQLRELLSIILQAGNYINSGEVDAKGGEERVRAFAIESLQSLASFKVGPISCLHFLCLTMRASDPSFISALQRSLKHVRPAAKDRFSQLRADVEAFIGEVNFSRARLKEMLPAPTPPESRQVSVVSEVGDACEASADNDCFWYARRPEVEDAEGSTEMGSRKSSKASMSATEPSSPGASSCSRGHPAAQKPAPVIEEMSDEALARERLSMLVSDFIWEADQLRHELQKAQQASADVQAYFSTSSGGSAQANVSEPKQESTAPAASPKAKGKGEVKGKGEAKGKGKGKGPGKGPLPPSKASAPAPAPVVQAARPKPKQVPPEQFFGYISGFLTMVEASWSEIERQPGKWRHFQKKADESYSCKATGAASLARQLSERPEPAESEAGDESPLTSPRHSARRASCPTPRGLEMKEDQSEKVLSPRRAALAPPRLTAAAAKARVPRLNLQKQLLPLSATPRKMSDLPPTPDEDRSKQRFMASLGSAGNSSRNKARTMSDFDAADLSLSGARVTPRASQASQPDELKKPSAQDALPNTAAAGGPRPQVPRLALQAAATTAEPKAPPLPYCKDDKQSDSSEERMSSRASFDSVFSAEAEEEVERSESKSSTNSSNDSVAWAYAPEGQRKAALPLRGRAVPPLRMPGAFSLKDVGQHLHVSSPKKFYSASSSEAPGTVRKLEEVAAPDCEFHQMNDSDDCEFHKMDSDSASCATQTCSSDEDDVLAARQRHLLVRREGG
eukprot:gb/GFBE01020410.1/.p1 GENE.gb/GFBE01020410.1/~~gb/GFBE01020410.1/.p1  ORF type:complete len:1181 (+),score=249.01 gb/GFBE01020410.1/:1-3543(+)